MERILKIKLSSYLVISSVSFSYLILPQRAGISVPIFVVIQFLCLFFIVPKRTPLLMFVPIFMLSLNSFISGSDIWLVSNFFVTLALYSLMVMMISGEYEFDAPALKFILDMTRNIYTPFCHFSVPIKWGLESSRDQGKLMKRILAGIVFSIPCLVFLITILSSADAVFSKHISSFFINAQSFLSANLLFRWLCGLVAGFYLFGLIYLSCQPREETSIDFHFKSGGDLLIMHIVLFSILLVYTVFTIIQFKYLFAESGELPYGLSYTYYARRGFFELLFLSGVNIGAILLVVELTQEELGFGVQLTRGLCCYLCLMTFILLFSSFYRMWLYNSDSGLTRLRFLVLGFLIFEAIGLVFTFIYIVKPQFNIIAIYLLIGLVYYLLLNIIPMDSFIAGNQIDRYLATGKGDIHYALSLSSDAAPQISKLLMSDDPRLIVSAQGFFSAQRKDYERFQGWRKYNLSAEKCKHFFDHNAEIVFPDR